jgi:hypothetical protein
MYSIALYGYKDLHENTYTNCPRDRNSYWEYTKTCEKQFPFSATSCSLPLVDIHHVELVPSISGGGGGKVYIGVLSPECRAKS